VLTGDVVISSCARTVGDIAAGELAGRPLSADDPRESAAALAERLGAAALLEPSGLRVRSYQVPAGDASADGPPGQLPGSSFDADLARVAGALRAGDGCAGGRIPPGRWLTDGPLARSEQFAVNEIMRCPGLFAVHARPRTGTDAVFSELVAAIVVERARRLAELPSPGAAFGVAREWESHAVRAPAQALTGFEIVLATPDEEPGLADVGVRWRDRAADADYFGSTSRLADGDGTWALLSARLGDRGDRRAFVERFWHGTVRGTDVVPTAGGAGGLAVVLSRRARGPGRVRGRRLAVRRARPRIPGLAAGRLGRPPLAAAGPRRPVAGPPRRARRGRAAGQSGGHAAAPRPAGPGEGARRGRKVGARARQRTAARRPGRPVRHLAACQA
jgi:hypothetical protein